MNDESLLKLDATLSLALREQYRSSHINDQGIEIVSMAVS